MPKTRHIRITAIGDQNLDDLANYIVIEHPGLMERADIRFVEDHLLPYDERSIIGEILITLDPASEREDDILAVEDILEAASQTGWDPVLARVASV
jgi:hypothetical protein